jgi:hypothetical protein
LKKNFFPSAFIAFLPSDMNKTLFALAAILFSSALAFSQDVILLATGEDLEVRIVEIGPDVIKYRKFDNPDGPIFNLPKSEAWMIRYENGPKVILKAETKTDSTSAGIPPDENAFNKGCMDAQKSYNGYKGAATGTLITSLLSPVIGLIPAIACSSTKPSELSLNYPSAKLMKNDQYRTGYMITAKKKKQGKVWTNWAIALGVNIFIYALVAS